MYVIWYGFRDQLPENLVGEIDRADWLPHLRRRHRGPARAQHRVQQPEGAPGSHVLLVEILPSDFFGDCYKSLIVFYVQKHSSLPVQPP